MASTAALVCVVGTDGRILLVNPALERAAGWTRDVSTGEAPSQEGDWLDRWGGRRRVSMTISVLRDGRGLPFAVDWTLCSSADRHRPNLGDSSYVA